VRAQRVSDMKAGASPRSVILNRDWSHMTSVLAPFAAIAPIGATLLAALLATPGATPLPPMAVPDPEPSHVHSTIAPRVPGAAAVAAGASGAAAPGVAGTAAVADDLVVYLLAPEGNQARYRVREQLAGLSFPSDAVGETSSVVGQFVFRGDGTLDEAFSRFTIDMATLESDSDRRDNFLRRNTLDVSNHPALTVLPRSVAGLPHPLPAAGEHAFVLHADVVLKGTTHPSTWEMTARFDGDRVTGTARTTFTFEELGLDKPRVGSVLSVADEIHLEYDFVLDRVTE